MNKLLTIAFVCISSCLLAQTTQVQVVTKRIEKTFKYQDGYEVNIEGQKAEVFVDTWDQPEIKIELELTAKHANAEVAKKDLEKMRYIATREKQNIYLRNYISSVDGMEKPTSKLSVKYVIKVPSECPIYLKNYLGISTVSNLSNRLRINAEFTQLGLDNIQGLVDIKTRFGDILGDYLDGNVTINSRRSNIKLTNISGNYDIQSQYGMLEIEPGKNLLGLNIDAEKTDVNIYSDNPELLAYALESKHSKLNLPNDMIFQFHDDVAVKKASFKPKEEYYANVKVSISFGEFSVEKKK